MDLLQLTYFRTVAYLEHMTKAAELLHVSQPSLSRTISNLEKELGVELFQRSGRSITLNAYGRQFLVHVNRALNELEDGKREIEETLTYSGGSIVIASSLSGFVTNAMDDFTVLHPEIHMSCRICSYPEILDLLESSEIDFGIAECMDTTRSPGWTTLSQEHFYVLFSPRHELARGQGALAFSDLAAYKLALPESGSSTRNILDTILAMQGILIRPTFEVTDVYAQLQLIQRGNTVTIIPSSALFDILESRQAYGYSLINGLRARPISGEQNTWSLEISPLSNRTGNALVGEFRDYCILHFTSRQQTMEQCIQAFCSGGA